MNEKMRVARNVLRMFILIFTSSEMTDVLVGSCTVATRTAFVAGATMQSKGRARRSNTLLNIICHLLPQKSFSDFASKGWSNMGGQLEGSFFRMRTADRDIKSYWVVIANSVNEQTDRERGI